MKTGTALLAAHQINAAGDEAPEWVHLLPAGEALTVDGRGPYRVADVTALMSASLATAKLAIDENHSTDIAAPKGQPAPAHGWIVDLQSRQDGIWGRVEWIDTPPGTIPIWKRYRGISPVIRHDKAGTVHAILRASLTNTPNLAGLVSLHSTETDMDFKRLLLEVLGLGGEADDAAITAAIAAMQEGKAEAVALQAALAPIAKAAGVADDADAATVLAGVQALKTGGDDRLVALQSEVTTLTTSLNAVQEERRRDQATAFVDAAIGAGRVGLKPVRDEYIALHMSDRPRAEKLVGAMPILTPGSGPLTVTPPEGSPDNPALLSTKASAYQKKLAEGGSIISYAAAVRAVAEGKSA